MNGMRCAMRVGEFAFGPLHTALWGMALKNVTVPFVLCLGNLGGGQVIHTWGRGGARGGTMCGPSEEKKDPLLTFSCVSGPRSYLAW